ncbi:hypothetical protein ASPBRDRAFT_40664 [Aspergillus brasiliensis CBS 101740]|uniref:Secreted protein n=1 Tax=Aspergillus brasiliensis (strain CBS 101740 / IMI 381727 / IBT 21946) TaxID=767769 RepID=A0A1L9UUF1_ASPBC|nr:hypothetical protein ASPBRDRAFT_40664 [Aspergillus brasiliensis CBS 101740]
MPLEKLWASRMLLLPFLLLARSPGHRRKRTNGSTDGSTRSTSPFQLPAEVFVHLSGRGQRAHARPPGVSHSLGQQPHDGFARPTPRGHEWLD